MIRQKNLSDSTVSGLRIRYFPKNRIGHGLITMAPWLDIVLLIIMFIFLNSELVLQPGIVVNLPQASFSSGLRSSLVVVILSIENNNKGNRDDIIFFNDERFFVKDEKKMKSLQNSLISRAHEKGEVNLIIQADGYVKQGTVAMLLNMARDAGVKKVDIASRTQLLSK